MTPLTKEWVEKAEADYFAGSLLLRSRKAMAWDSVCFHGQQCAEKYLKALLQEHHIRFPKTHDLVELAQLLAPKEPHWSLLLPKLRSLTREAIVVRYPGVTSTKQAAKDAMTIAADVQEHARVSLGIVAAQASRRRMKKKSGAKRRR
jgi:HEPN domain-containing protein